MGHLQCTDARLEKVFWRNSCLILRYFYRWLQSRIARNYPFFVKFYRKLLSNFFSKYVFLLEGYEEDLNCVSQLLSTRGGLSGSHRILRLPRYSRSPDPLKETVRRSAFHTATWWKCTERVGEAISWGSTHHSQCVLVSLLLGGARGKLHCRHRDIC